MASALPQGVIMKKSGEQLPDFFERREFVFWNQRFEMTTFKCSHQRSGRTLMSEKIE